MHTSWKSYLNRISKTKISLADWAFHHRLGKDSYNEVATKQLTPVVYVTFMPHDNSEIS